MALAAESEAAQKALMEAEGWQGGSVCAAAAVAGAWNAAHGQSLVAHLGKPAHGLALCTRDVLDVYEAMLGKKGGSKLYRNKANTKAKMSTWCIGNDKIIRAVKSAHTKVRNGNTHLRTTARTYINTKELDKTGEAPERNHAAWEAVKTALATPRVVLLFHTKNHYCLISAWREVRDDESGTLRRQLMFAPKGQRPDRVIDWDDVVRIITHYKTYKILRIEGYSVTDPAMAMSDDALPPSSEAGDVPVVWMGADGEAAK
ncbi:uncharacterized protein AMSG_05884 [Thecamonas trahens ATCC 50062]|uniref:Uncharacterized protein n=1 Tax=Thecamonas trahens ATCC 50062 TaxID=461836 RepID=A0A0L0DDE5_THETB|nr:hypothetical protein AMSG_05884 [Thecamonas trahens ATCC 50062]KNC50111.1 hypothetical protein AMSG_05884 [Thecamonas trahens ATCC 50062]|eukprot:XP_013757270.1 hypothetical protein AMSG_05884 [Thecamonas trahens ATCC 50062]